MGAETVTLFDRLERVSVRDLLTWAVPHTPAEILDGDPLARLGPHKDLRHFDRREHYDPKVWGWFRDPRKLKKTKRNDARRAIPFGRRTAAETTAFCLHTMAVRVGWRRCLGMPVQLAVDEDAVAVLCNPLLAQCAHGHAYNRFSMGLEISGKSDITGRQILTARRLIMYGYDEVMRLRKLEGCDSDRMAIGTHFMATKKRGLKDPGRVIWEEVGEWAIKTLGLVRGPVVGSGQDIPTDWTT